MRVRASVVTGLFVAAVAALPTAQAQDAALVKKWEASEGKALAEKLTRDCLTSATHRETCVRAAVDPCMREIGGGTQLTAFCFGLGADVWAKVEREAADTLEALLKNKPDALAKRRAARLAWEAWQEAETSAVYSASGGSGGLIAANASSLSLNSRYALDLLDQIEIERCC